MEQIPADAEFFQELGMGRFGHVGISVVGFIPACVIIHRLLQGGSDAHIIHHQPPFLVAEHAVDAGNGLHEVMAAHRLVDIHGRQGGHVKPGQPHIHHNGDFHRAVIILELPGQFIFVALVADDFPPFFRIIISGSHHHFCLFCPFRAQFQHAPVNFHGDGAGISHNHGLARQQAFPVMLIVVQNVADKGINGVVIAQNGFHLPQLPLAAFNHVRVGVGGHELVFVINPLQGFLIQIQFDHPAFIVNRAGGSVLNRLSHVIDVNVVPEHFAGASVFGGDGSSRKADIGGIRQAVADDARRADNSFGNFLAFFICGNPDLFRQPVLPTVGLIRHDDDVSAFGKSLMGFLKLLHGGKENPVGFPPL